MSFDPYAPYGPLVESTLRIVSWNVWGRYGDNWKERQAGIEDELVVACPDIVCLVEAWRQGETSQPEMVAERWAWPTIVSLASGSRRTGYRDWAWCRDGR